MIIQFLYSNISFMRDFDVSSIVTYTYFTIDVVLILIDYKRPLVKNKKQTKHFNIYLIIDISSN